ncbi:MAG: DUF2085 domain-containing protein [Deltaproteobacteria bacterium]|nr:DUF2085 domain-containing protein [Deltaproteobacteria bacterium]
MVRRLLGTGGVVALSRVALGALVLLAVGMPLWERLGIGDAVRIAFGPYCHQRGDRSFELLGVVLPICARCTGLYVGAFVASIALPLVRSPRTLVPLWVLFASAAPMAIDLGLEHLVGAAPNAAARLSTGLVLGAAAVAFLLPVLVRAGEEILARCETRNSTSRA